MNAKQRRKNRLTAQWLQFHNPPTKRCINCGELSHHGHFVPPSFGEEGFFICEKKK